MVFFGLAGFFYLFQVVYPQSQRFTPAPQQVLALSSADPTARAVLSKMKDRDFMILPTEADAESAAKLDAMVPVFHPSFEKHEMQLQDLPYKAFTVPPARLLRMNEPVLPPLDLSELKPIPVRDGQSAAPAPRLAIKLTGGASNRTLISKPDLNGLSLAEPEMSRFHVGIDGYGIVQVALPLDAMEAELAQKLTVRLKQLRFQPTARLDAAPDWGVASFEWISQP